MKYFFIINGRKDKNAILVEVEQQVAACASLVEERGDTTEIYITTGEGDATREVRLYSDLHPNEKVCFIACGGDGTVNEVASGMVGFANKTLAVLALHSNNDFIKYYPEHRFVSFQDIILGNDTVIDIIKINDSYAINACDIGFDSVVAKTANELSAENKKNVFRKGIARAILTGRFNRMKIYADGKRIGHNILLLCTLANGRYVGGEFLCAPRALNDDGLIEVCYIRPMSLLTFLLMIPIYARGEHLTHPIFSKKLIYCQAKHVEITSRQMIDICLDGELLPGTHFNIDIISKAITLRLPKKS